MTYRDLGKALHYGDAEARALWQGLRRRGLLNTTGSEPGIGGGPEGLPSDTVTGSMSSLRVADLAAPTAVSGAPAVELQSGVRLQ